MVKVKDIEFNILTFALKTALVILSIAVSILLLVFFEQNALAIRSVFLRNDVGNPQALMRINEKEIERLITSALPSFIVSKTVIVNVCKFISIVCVDVLAVLYFILTVMLSNTKVENLEYKVEKKEEIALEDNSESFNVYNKLNVKLTI